MLSVGADYNTGHQQLSVPSLAHPSLDHGQRHIATFSTPRLRQLSQASPASQPAVWQQQASQQAPAANPANHPFWLLLYQATSQNYLVESSQTTSIQNPGAGGTGRNPLDSPPHSGGSGISDLQQSLRKLFEKL